MRYSSKEQEKYANNGRVTVTKVIRASGFHDYEVRAGNILVMPPHLNKQYAIDQAKLVAVGKRMAFNPRIDYTEIGG